MLASEEVARNCRTEPVWVLGHGQHASHTTMSEWTDMTVGPAAVSGARAFAMAGLSPSDMDLACVYDAFTYMLLLTMEDLGFCAKGEGGAFVESGALRLGGAMPTNPDGGGLSACHPGMRGLFLLVEAAKQLRGDYASAGATDRQVAGASKACVSGTGGWFCSNGTVILGTD